MYPSSRLYPSCLWTRIRSLPLFSSTDWRGWESILGKYPGTLIVRYITDFFRYSVMPWLLVGMYYYGHYGICPWSFPGSIVLGSLHSSIRYTQTVRTQHHSAPTGHRDFNSNLTSDPIRCRQLKKGGRHHRRSLWERHYTTWRARWVPAYIPVIVSCDTV